MCIWWCLWVIVVTIHGTNSIKFLFERLIVTQLLKNLISSNKTWEFMSVFKKVPFWALFWARWINLNNLLVRFGSFFFILLWWDETRIMALSGVCPYTRLAQTEWWLTRNKQSTWRNMCQCNFVYDKSHKDFLVLDLLYGVGSRTYGLSYNGLS